jgi:glycerol-3-phosphate dehydrogenase
VKVNLSNEKALLKRDESLRHLETQETWDILIIGGGATGLGIAVDAASRGFRTLLLERSDFAKGTSSRSTKLVHGGVRYLAQANVGLVYGALRERGLLVANAPHVVKRQSFVIPCYSFFERVKYLAGLKIYDFLSGHLSFGPSRFVNRKQMMDMLPAVNTTGLVGGVQYFDGQFDDARLAINLAETSKAEGGVLLNYINVSRLLKKDNRVRGVVAVDLETNREYSLHAHAVVNATGVFVDEVLHMDNENSHPIVRPSQGIHLVFDKSFLKGGHAVMIPKTSDGRVLFAVPWHEHVLVGTTDTPLDKHSIEPTALEEEIKFILQTVSEYFIRKPERKDVLSVFAGLRPLAASQNDTDSTKEISRDHKLIVSASGLITITGGKWTTYRKMAEDTVNKAIETAGLKYIPCKTKHLPVHGSSKDGDPNDHLFIYGTDAAGIRSLINENPSLNTKLIERLPYTCAEVVWAVRHEMARTVEDVLARRLRLLFLDAKAALQVAPKTAEIMAAELGRDENWQKKQISEFGTLANNYLL